MTTRTSFWIKTAAIFQLLTGLMHSITLFVQVPPQNETEKQLFGLMETYKPDFGAGFKPSWADMLLALSSCMSLLCFMAGLINFYLLKKQVNDVVMKGVININLLIFGICFAIMAAFTFLFPIVCIGLIFFSLLISRISFERTALK